jgi:hypothetical protein
VRQFCGSIGVKSDSILELARAVLLRRGHALLQLDGAGSTFVHDDVLEVFRGLRMGQVFHK